MRRGTPLKKTKNAALITHQDDESEVVINSQTYPKAEWQSISAPSAKARQTRQTRRGLSEFPVAAPTLQGLGTLEAAQVHNVPSPDTVLPKANLAIQTPNCMALSLGSGYGGDRRPSRKLSQVSFMLASYSVIVGRTM